MHYDYCNNGEVKSKLSIIRFHSVGEYFMLYIYNPRNSSTLSFFVKMVEGQEACDKMTATINIFNINTGEGGLHSHRSVVELVPIDDRRDLVPEHSVEFSDRQIKRLLTPKDSSKTLSQFGLSVSIEKK